MKKLVLLMLAFALSVPAFAHAPAQLAATHRIEMQSPVLDPDTGKPQHGICSATAIGPHALLTARHCDMVGMTYLKVDDKTALIKERMWDNADHEIFIVDEKFDVTADFERTDALRKGDDVWMEGNAAGWPQLVRRGVYSGNMMIEGKVAELYDYNGFFGDSGSAIFDEHGRIVAVTSVYVSSGNIFGEFKLMGAWPLHFSSEQIKAAQEK